MATIEAPPLRNFLSARYWPTWLGIAVLCLVAWSPWRVRVACGRLLGVLAYRLGRERRYITRTNIALCFPELDEAEREALVKKSFKSSGLGLIETAAGWIRHPRHFSEQVEIIGLDELLAARAEGRGVLMLGAHYSTLDFAANLLSLSCPFAVTYRPHKNALFDAFMQRGRLRNCNAVFDRNDIRGAFKHLKKGGVLWYAPDQDYGPDHAVYAPFFGRRAATITTPARFAAFNDSPVVMVRHHRKEDEEGYELEFRRLTEPYPSGDDARDATLINRKTEEGIRRYPDQYLWMHKRFKTQPGGKPESPYIDMAATPKRIRPDQGDRLCANAVPLEAERGRVKTMKLASGLHLHLYPGLPWRPLRSLHPACRFDERSRRLRLSGIRTATVDGIFMLPKRHVTLLTWHRPPGRGLHDLCVDPASDFPLTALARFLASLHAKGFGLAPRPDLILHDGEGFSLLDPMRVQYWPTSLSYLERCANLEGLFDELSRLRPGLAARAGEFREEYARAADLEDVAEFTACLFRDDERRPARATHSHGSP